MKFTRNKNGSYYRLFTLIELLICIAIIMILAALLMPTMSRVKYRAKLVVCSSNLKQVGTAVTTYASDSSSRYPSRSINGVGSTWSVPECVKSTDVIAGVLDDGERFIDVGLEEIYCPFAGKLDYRSSKKFINSSYEYYFSYLPDRANATAMNKVGKAMTYKSNEFSILAADQDLHHSTMYRGAHPDRDTGVLKYTIYSGMELICWRSGNVTPLRGPVDRNFLYTDGSVTLFNRVLTNTLDSRMTKVAYKYNSGGSMNTTTSYRLLPNE